MKTTKQVIKLIIKQAEGNKGFSLGICYVLTRLEHLNIITEKESVKAFNVIYRQRPTREMNKKYFVTSHQYSSCFWAFGQDKMRFGFLKHLLKKKKL